MKTCTANQLADLEKYAGLYLSIQDIALIFDWSEADLKTELKNTQSPIYRAFAKGRALTEVRLRESIQKNAFRGSVPAQNTLLNWIKKKQDLDE